MLIGFAPILWIFFVTLALRRPPVQAALSGAALAAGLWLAGVGGGFAADAARAAAADALALFASVAAVMAPGLWLVALLGQEQGQSNQKQPNRPSAHIAFGQWLRGLGLSPPQQVVFIALGLAPMLEALTGFGISLIATAPLLLTLFPREAALRMALGCMVSMPWGVMGLPTLTGAALLGMDAARLGAQTAWSSAPVFAALTLMVMALGGLRRPGALLYALAGVAVFVPCLHASSRWLGVEMGGVCAGLAVIAAHLAWACGRGRRQAHRALQPRLRPPAALWPYGLLLAMVIALKGLWLLTGWDEALIWRGAQTAWRPLASPGLPLLLLCLALRWHGRRHGHDRRSAAEMVPGTPAAPAASALRPPAWLRRAARPLLTIFGFLLMSQIMVKGGFMQPAQAWLATLDGPRLGLTIAAVGAVGGYLTGSNMGGNVLMMPAIAHFASGQWGDGVALAAVMNSAAAHAALGSLPMVALLAGLAQASAAEEARLARFALLLAVCNTALVALAAWALTA